MNRIILTSLLMTVVAVPAFAQSVPVAPVTKEAVAPIHDRVPPYGFTNNPPVGNSALESKLTDEQTAAMLCQAARLMKPEDSAEYKAGVDAYGRPVAPADAGQQAFQVPDRVDIPVHIDILKNMGIVNTPTPALGTDIGTVSVMKGGQIQFNGRDLTNNVTAYCNGQPLPSAQPGYAPRAQTQQKP